VEKTWENHQDSKNQMDSYLIKDNKIMIIDWWKNNENGTIVALI
jgi:flavorubredoxin